jgi:hypothetical protein
MIKASIFAVLLLIYHQASRTTTVVYDEFRWRMSHNGEE